MRKAIDVRQADVDRARLSELLMPPLGAALEAQAPRPSRASISPSMARLRHRYSWPLFPVRATRCSYHRKSVVRVTVNLKNVTVREALDSLRELYGTNTAFRVRGYLFSPLALQTRIFRSTT